MNQTSCHVTASAEVLPDRRIAVTWEDGQTSAIHFVWLRQQHFHPAFGRPDQTDADQPRLPDDPETLRVKNCRLENGHLIVEWANDGARTQHDLEWLRDHAYDTELRLARKLRPAYWTGSEAADFPWFHWDEIMEDPAQRWKLFTAVRDYGFARLRNAPVEPGSVKMPAERFGPIRVTDFGTVFDIISRPQSKSGRGANIGATASNHIGPHTDEGWRYSPPGINFHLCLESTPGAGGASMLVDGLLAAQRLHKNDPDAYQLLTKVPILFAAERNPQERFRAHGRLIAIDIDGDVTGIRFSDRTMGVQDLPEDLIEPAYRAIRAFANELYQPDLVYQHALQPGECHVFDNHRVLHARTAFDAEAGPRRIQQCSVDREEFHSRYRILANELGHAVDANMILLNGALG